MIPKIGETISAEQFNRLPEVGETISAEQFASLEDTTAKPEGFIQGITQSIAQPFLRIGATAMGKPIGTDYLGKGEPITSPIKEGGIFTPPGQKF